MLFLTLFSVTRPVVTPIPPRIRFRLASAAGMVALATGIVAPLPALAAQFVTDYTISYSGLPVARSTFISTVDGNALKVEGSLQSAGLGALFSSTSGSASLSGRISGNRIESERYEMRYTSGKKSSVTRIAFSGGNVTESWFDPPSKPRADRVAVKPNQLKGVVDPLMAGIVAASSAGRVCNRTIQFFDGELRGDLVLRSAGSEKFSARGYKGDAIRCAVKFKPVSGYRTSNKSIAYMSKGERAIISFAPIAGTQLYAPVKVQVTTSVGTVTVRATRFEQTGS